MKKIFLLILSMFLILSTVLCGCREVDRVSYNVSKEADNFNTVRRLTVINMRSDKVIMQMTGTFSIKTDVDGDLNIICEIPGGTYQKHFVHLNNWITYVVEDISGAEVSKYSYELEFMPEALKIVKITSNETAT